jgi:hypothetical protein
MAAAPPCRSVTEPHPPGPDESRGADGGAAGPLAVEHDPRLRPRLLRAFDRDVPRVRRVLEARYGAQETAALVGAARREYAALIPQLPHIGGRRNPLTGNLQGAALFLAIWRVLRRRGTTPAEAGRLFHEMMEAWLGSYPGFLLRLLGRLRFTPWYRRALRRRAAASRGRRFPGDFVYDYVEGDGEAFDFGVDYTECGIVKLLRAQGAAELAPHLCPLDYPLSRAMGLGLVRTQTLAEGAPRCDFRFKRGRETREVPTRAAPRRP